MLPNKNEKFNKFMQMLGEISSGDRNKLIYQAVKIDHVYTMQQVADILGMTKQNINIICNAEEEKRRLDYVEE